MKTASKIIVKKDKGEIAPHSKFVWTNENIVVPSIPPRLSRCKIIQITYTLELDVRFFRCFQIQFSCVFAYLHFFLSFVQHDCRVSLHIYIYVNNKLLMGP